MWYPNKIKSEKYLLFQHLVTIWSLYYVPSVGLNNGYTNKNQTQACPSKLQGPDGEKSKKEKKISKTKQELLPTPGILRESFHSLTPTTDSKCKVGPSTLWSTNL